VVYVNAAPESYVKFATDYHRLSEVPDYLAIRAFSTPPRLSDLQGFDLGDDDVKGLKACKPGDCVIQLPASTMADLQKSVNWSASNVRILGAVYNDKSQQVNVADQFKYMISYAQVLPRDLPEFYNCLLDYPQGKPANVQNSFYWDSVKFGLKPTLRMVHVFILQGDKPQEPA
jgi:hypothetical protein